MQLAQVIGRATATVKHPTLAGWRMLVLQTLDQSGRPEGEPQIAVDYLGSDLGNRVIVTADGATARDIVGSNNTPIRHVIVGIVDT